MMFTSYSEHSEPLFNEAKILNIVIEKINDFLISLFMFRYHYLDNLYQNTLLINMLLTTKYMNTIQETRPNLINHTQELILSNIHFTIRV
jgi:hypothetical protein